MPGEIHFQVGDVQLNAQEWGKPGDFPVLALHGWLDNSASFSRLAPLIENVHLLALDLAGHGQSGHRPRFAPYNIWEDVSEVFAVADQMGWGKFALIGHSRGAIISMLAAGTFPERITHLGLIDGFWPEPVAAAEAPEQLARSIRELNNLRSRSFAVYSELESAIKVRQKVSFALSYQAARAIVERGVKRVQGGYSWSADPQLQVASSVKFTQDHIAAFTRRITALTKLVLAEQGLRRRFELERENLSAFESIEVDTLPGGHHLHMEAQSLRIAELLNGLFARSL